ncbi:ribonuclease H-like domain, reverse transcriptase, RNA-dependent DNA polymerase [Tanacetum coccineum]
MPVEAKVDGKDEQSTKNDDSTAGEAVTTASVEDSVAPTTITEITLAQILIQIKVAKPKVVTIAATTTTTTRPKDKGVVVHEPNEEKAKLFMELMEKRRKHFAALRAQEKRNRPPTKAQKSTQMYTYLKHMGGYTYKQLKGKSFDEIQKLFNKEMKRVNTFVAMSSEVQESKEKKEEGRDETVKGSRKKMLGRKRAGKEQQQESSKKQKVEKEKESDKVDEYDEAELKKLLVIKKDEDIAIDAIPLATKLPVIIDYKLHKEGMQVHYQLIRADGSFKRYSSMIRMLQGIDKDLEALWRIVKAKYGDTRPVNEFERVLVTIWKLIDSSGVHFVRFDNLHIFMLVEKRYPLTPITITNMLNKKLQTDHQNEMCYQLLKLMVKQQKGLRRLKKVGMSRRFESSEDQESLGDHEDASKQGRSIEDIDADAEVTLVNETQERQDDDLMFDTGVLDDDEVFVDVTTVEKEEQSTKTGETLMEIKAAKPKAKGIVLHDQEEQFEIIEEERLERKKQEEANIALIESWENTQAMMEADRLLAKRLQTREREELTDKEKGKLFMELIKKRRKHFAKLRAQEKRNGPPTKAHKRTQMSTYLKHMVPLLENRVKRIVVKGYEDGVHAADLKAKYTGAENLAADHLSRLENPHQGDLEKKEITETFPLETLGMISFHGDSNTPWFADIANYHAGNFVVKKGMSFPTKERNKYILVAVDYLSKWVAAKALPTNDARVVKFLKYLFARCGTPRAIICDRGIYFCSDQFAKVMLKKVSGNSILKHDLCELVTAKIDTTITNYSTRSSTSGKKIFQEFNDSGIISGERFCCNPFRQVIDGHKNVLVPLRRWERSHKIDAPYVKDLAYLNCVLRHFIFL